MFVYYLLWLLMMKKILIYIPPSVASREYEKQ